MSIANFPALKFYAQHFAVKQALLRNWRISTRRVVGPFDNRNFHSVVSNYSFSK